MWGYWINVVNVNLRYCVGEDVMQKFLISILNPIVMVIL